MSLFNQFQKVVRAQACPGCGISIIKDEGGKHMVCQKCKKEFGWYGLGDYPSYVHKGVIFCPFRIILKVLIWIWLITFTVNLKLAIQYSAYQRFMIQASYWIGVFLLANLMFFSVGLSFFFKQGHHELRHSSGGCSAFWRMTGGLLSFLWPAAWISSWVLAYIYWGLGETMLWILLWEFVALLGIAVLVFLIIVLVKGIKRRRERARQRLYENLTAEELLMNENTNEYWPDQIQEYNEPNNLIYNNNQSVLSDLKQDPDNVLQVEDDVSIHK